MKLHLKRTNHPNKNRRLHIGHLYTLNILEFATENGGFFK